MAFLLFLPLAIFGLTVALMLSVHIRIEITERRRVVFKSMRRIFRPVVIEGGKGKIAAIDPPPARLDHENAQSDRIKLVR